MVAMGHPCDSDSSSSPPPLLDGHRRGLEVFPGIALRRPTAHHAGADISALIRCTVPVPTPSVAAILRIPMSPFFNALRIAASVAAVMVGERTLRQVRSGRHC